MDYNYHKIPNYNELKMKLMTILFNNKNSKNFEYYGTKINKTLGIIVKGSDSIGIRDFERFFSIKDINYYFDRIKKRINKS